MLFLAIRRFIVQHSNGTFMSTNFVATSSNFLLMDQENDKETKKDFRKIVKLLERSPTQKRKKEQEKAEENEKRDKREENGREEERTNWKEHISKSLHKSYDEYATRKSMENWKRRARRDTFCYMRDRNLPDLVTYTHRYIEGLTELNGKNNQRSFEDNELIVVVLKFVMNELLKGNNVQSARNERTEKKPK
ncbi:hypothetical protein niasHT_007871 [Heterodera trifolii]|uniref:Uncharacterized protein n=1 Tax=Heterodera trifolii TaxID=157864 RepID=A0ABD2M297_9BILA